MDLIIIIFVFACAVLIMQLSFSGRLDDQNYTIKKQAELLSEKVENEALLYAEVIKLTASCKHLSSEVARLERMNNG